MKTLFVIKLKGYSNKFRILAETYKEARIRLESIVNEGMFDADDEDLCLSEIIDDYESYKSNPVKVNVDASYSDSSPANSEGM